MQTSTTHPPAAFQSHQGAVGRFAPTPSGPLHVGNLYAMMLTWLAAHYRNGYVVMRIEDIDYARCKPQFATEALKLLEWLGLTWEGPEVYQHQRLDLYREAFEDLRRWGRAYPCFCSRADWHAASAPHRGDHFVYPGTCRNLTPQEIFKKSQVKSCAWRFLVSDDEVSFTDLFQGPQTLSLPRDCGDPILIRSDGGFSYQLAVCVDDIDQGVTQVVRGCDLVESTPVQMDILSALSGCSLSQYHPMEYCHTPLIVDGDGRRLAKRDGDLSVIHLAERFKTPQRVLGYIAAITSMIPLDGKDASTLRENPPEVTMEQLLERFSPQDYCTAQIPVAFI